MSMKKRSVEIIKKYQKAVRRYSRMQQALKEESRRL